VELELGLSSFVSRRAIAAPHVVTVRFHNPRHPNSLERESRRPTHLQQPLARLRVVLQQQAGLAQQLLCHVVVLPQRQRAGPSGRVLAVAVVPLHAREALQLVVRALALRPGRRSQHGQATVHRLDDVIHLGWGWG